MTVTYTMFGYDEQHKPFAEMHVDADRARKLASEHGLSGYILSPHNHDEGNINARMLNDEGEYKQAKTREWVFTELLARGWSDGSEYGIRPGTKDRHP